MYASHIPISPSLRSRYNRNYGSYQGQGYMDQQYSGEYGTLGNSFFDNPINPHEELGNSFRDSCNKVERVSEDVQKDYNQNIGGFGPVYNNTNLNLNDNDAVYGGSNIIESHSVDSKNTSSSDKQNETKSHRGLPPVPSAHQSNSIKDKNPDVSGSRYQPPVQNRSSFQNDSPFIKDSISNSGQNMNNSGDQVLTHSNHNSLHNNVNNYTPQNHHPTSHIGHFSIAAQPTGPQTIASNVGPPKNSSNTHNSGLISSDSSLHHHSHHLPPPPPPPSTQSISSHLKHPKVPFLDTSKIRDHEESVGSSVSSSFSKKMQDNKERLEQLNISHSKLGLLGVLKDSDTGNGDVIVGNNVHDSNIKFEDSANNKASNINIDVNGSLNLQNMNKNVNISNHRLPPKAPKAGDINPTPFGVNNVLFKQKSEELSLNKCDRNNMLQSKDIPIAIRPPTAPTFYASGESHHHDEELNIQIRDNKIPRSSNNGNDNVNFRADLDIKKQRDLFGVQQASMQRPPTAPNVSQKSGNLPKVDMLINLMGKTVENKRRDFEKLSKLKNVLSELGDFNKRLLEENTRLRSGNSTQNRNVNGEEINNSHIDSKRTDLFKMESHSFPQITSRNDMVESSDINNKANCTDHISQINSLKTIISKKNHRISELERKIAETNSLNSNSDNVENNKDENSLCFDLLEKLKIRDKELVDNLNEINDSDLGEIIDKLGNCASELEQKRSSSKLRVLLNDTLNQIEFNYKALSVTIEHLVDQQNSTLETINTGINDKGNEIDQCIAESDFHVQSLKKETFGHEILTKRETADEKLDDFDSAGKSHLVSNKEGTKQCENASNTLDQSQKSFDLPEDDYIYEKNYKEKNHIVSDNERKESLNEYNEYGNVGACYYDNIQDISDSIDNGVMEITGIGEYQYKNVNMQRELSSEEIGYQYEPKIEQFTADWIRSSNGNDYNNYEEEGNLNNYSYLDNSDINSGFVNDMGRDLTYINNRNQHHITSESKSSVPPPVLAAYYDNSEFQSGDMYENIIGGSEQEFANSDSAGYKYYQIPSSLSNI